MNIPEYYEDMSLRLTEILDASGLGDDLRWQKINNWLQIEELDRIMIQMVVGTDLKTFFFGSQAEATTTHELFSDIDKVAFIKTVVVLQDLQFWVSSPNNAMTLLMVTDEYTPPGYVKLHLVHRDAPVLVNNYQDEIVLLDSKRRSVLSNNTTFTKLSIAYEYHGPANTSYVTGILSDTVCALHTSCWPDQASRWLSSRSRRYNWPTRKMIDVIQRTGILLVPVGHKLSPEHHLEWRLAFSFGEKLLMWQFNSTQYKCYVMLKFIKNTFINVDVKENVLTSYHCKTCIFYLIESTPASLWHPYNLLLCIDLCLRQLLSWVECKNCPNYFVPDENMFLGRNLDPVQRRITGILLDLLMQKGTYITMITYENIGENIVRVCQSLPMELDHVTENTLHITFCFLESMLQLVCILIAHRNVCQLDIFKSSNGFRQEALNILLPLLCSSLGNHLASQSLEEEIPDQEKLGIAHELLLWGTSSDVASGYLKLAAFYLSQSNLDRMEELPYHVDAKLTHNVWKHGIIVANESMYPTILHENLSIPKLVQHYVALPVCYGSLDIYSVPKVLIFEMFCSTGSEPGIDRLITHWIPIAAVTARLYLYFLQYQCFHLRGRSIPRSVALNNIIWMCKFGLETLDWFQTHKADICLGPDIPFLTLVILTQVTTTLNLLAYCLKQGGIAKAFNVLCKSMKIKNQHNAAKWQIATAIVCRGSNIRQGQ